MFNLLRDRHRSDADRSRYILVPKRMEVANELEKEHVYIANIVTLDYVLLALKYIIIA